MKRLLFFTFLLSLLVTFGNEGWLRFYRLRQFERSLQKKITDLQEGNLLLQKETQSLRDPESVETLVRDQMGYVRKNEILYEFAEEGPGHP